MVPYLCEARSAPSGAAPSRGIHGRQESRLIERSGGFFLCRVLGGRHGKITAQIFRRSTEFTGPGAAFSLECTVRKLSTAARPSSCGQHKSRSSRSGFSVPPEFADTRILRTFRAAIGLFPRRTQQNLCHFVAFIGSQKITGGGSPMNAYGPPAHKIMVLLRSPF